MAVSAVVKGGIRDDGNETFLALESSSIILNKDDCNKFLLQPYYNFGNYTSTENVHPKKKKFPPTNAKEKSPPIFNDWKKKNNISGGSKNSNGENVSVFVSILGQLVNGKNKDSRCDDENGNNNSIL